MQVALAHPDHRRRAIVIERSVSETRIPECLHGCLEENHARPVIGMRRLKSGVRRPAGFDRNLQPATAPSACAEGEPGGLTLTAQTRKEPDARDEDAGVV